MSVEILSDIVLSHRIVVAADVSERWQCEIRAPSFMTRPVDTGGRGAMPPPIICQTCFGDVINAA